MELDEDSNDNVTSYYVEENWRWYIFCAERKIDNAKIPEMKLPPIMTTKLSEFTCFLPEVSFVT